MLERAHVEREINDYAIGPNFDNASASYERSGIPVFVYNGGYSLPEVVLQSTVAADRLKVEWQKPADQFAEEVNQVLHQNENKGYFNEKRKLFGFIKRKEHT